MKLHLLDISKMAEVDSEEDPLKYYKLPFLNYFYFKRLELTVRLLGNRKFDTLLDLGYGSGILFPELYSRCNQLFGIDKHGKSHIVTEILAKENIAAKLYDGGITDLPFDNEVFDCVVCLSVLDHIKEISKTSSEIYRVIKPQGILIVGLVSQNLLTDFGFFIIRAKTNIYHVSTNLEIISEIKKRFKLVNNIWFPHFIPRKWALYTCWEFKKE